MTTINSSSSSISRINIPIPSALEQDAREAKKSAAQSPSPQVGWQASDASKSSRAKLMGHTAASGIDTGADVAAATNTQRTAATKPRFKPVPMPLTAAEKKQTDKLGTEFLVLAEKVIRAPKDAKLYAAYNEKYLQLRRYISELTLKKYPKRTIANRQGIGSVSTAQAVISAAKARTVAMTNAFANTKDVKKKFIYAENRDIANAYVKEYTAQLLKAQNGFWDSPD